MAYYSGQGRLYVADRDGSGNPQGFRAIGNVPSLELSIETTKFEHKESLTGSRAVDLTIVQEKKGTFTMTVEDMDLDNLALAFWGANTAITAGTASIQTLVAYLGFRTAILGVVTVSNVVIKDDATKLITYQFGTSVADVASKNGWVDQANGSFVVFDSATQTANGAANNITDLQVLEVTYDNAAASRLDSFTLTSQEKYMRFEGLNTIDQKAVVVDVFKASLDPLTGYGLINEEVSSFEITGNVLSDDLQTGATKFFRQINAA